VPTKSESEELTVRPFVSSEARTYAKSGNIAQIRDVRPASGDLKGPIPVGVLIEKALASPTETSPEKPRLVPPAATDSPQGALEKVFDQIVPSAQAQEGDVPDPMAEHPETEAPKKQERVILFSNDLFVVNGVIANAGNSDLFMNSLSYLLQDSELIGIRPRDLRQTFLKLTSQDIRKVWGFILIVAGVFMVLGFRAARRKAVVA
jgi:ABC-type uncharacterized transport system involved in gliding motility auxiliary subunit